MTKRKRQFVIGGLVLLVVLLLSLSFCGRNKKPTTFADPSVMISALQRVESALVDVRAALVEGLAKLDSRVEALENKPAPKTKAIGVTSSMAVKSLAGKLDQLVARVEEIDRRLKEAGAKLATEETEPIAFPPPDVVVDLTPVERGLREGLGVIADSIRQSKAETQSAPPIAKPVDQQEPVDPCAAWVQDQARYRRCRLYNQLP